MDVKQSYTRTIIAVVIFLFAFILQNNISFAAHRFPRAVVYMEDKYFYPETIMIRPGQMVTWINKGHHDHTVTGRTFNSGHIPSGGRVSFMFMRPGTYDYVCTLHSFLGFGMHGKVIVR